MKPLVFTYENSEKQTVHFRGYFKIYKGTLCEIHSCKEVRTNKLKAIDDVKKAIKRYARNM